MTHNFISKKRYCPQCKGAFQVPKGNRTRIFCPSCVELKRVSSRLNRSKVLYEIYNCLKYQGFNADMKTTIYALKRVSRNGFGATGVVGFTYRPFYLDHSFANKQILLLNPKELEL